MNAVGAMGWDYQYLGQFEKGLEYFDKAIRLSPHDPYLSSWYQGEAVGYFALKQYDHTIEWARRAIAIDPNTNPWLHFNLIPALALNGDEAEAHEALQTYLATVPSGPKTIAAWKAFAALYTSMPNPSHHSPSTRVLLRPSVTGITTACARRECRRGQDGLSRLLLTASARRGYRRSEGSSLGSLRLVRSTKRGLG
jgi:tetratricopeptide (TPR) repeat protein